MDIFGATMTVENVEKAVDPFELWLADRPKWLQTAASDLIAKRRMPSDAEIAILASLCGKEASGENDLPFTAILPGALAAAPGRPRLHIHELTEVSGVNAIKPGAKLDFSDANITVIYGPNGSGKTGYSRLLKHACGSRVTEEILSNIFDEGIKLSTAKIHISVGGVKSTVDWDFTAPPIKALRDVHIFDSRSASMYMGPKNEATYEPRRMRFLSSLITVCDRVSASIEAEKNLQILKMPMVPPDLLGTVSGKWVAALKGTSAQAEVEKHCSYAQAFDDERIASEQALNQKDIPARLQALVKEASIFAQVKTGVDALKLAFGDVNVSPIIVARKTAQVKRKAATDDAKAVFAQAPLDGVGEASWLALWSYARKYSELHAYPGMPFPVVADHSRCVLCQHELGPEDMLRLVSFEEFVTKGLEADAVAAEAALNNLKAKIPILPTFEAWKLQSNILKFDDGYAEAAFTALETKWNAIKTVVEVADVPGFDWTAFEEKIVSLESSINAEKKALTELQQDGKRKQLEARLLDLKCAQWLSQNRGSVVEEIARLGTVKALDKASALAKTNALTTKKNELGEHELNAGYQTRFAEELELLGGKRIPVGPQSKKEGKGKISFGLALTKSKRPTSAGQVLSEGETRIVTLAAFLADISGSGEPTPFIFDDPISSLDQSFEERVVARLVELSKSRQVVVFTHRLSLLTLIEDTVGRLKAQGKHEAKPDLVSLHIQSLRRLGNVVGLTNQLNIRESNPQSAANRLRDEVIPQLAKLYEKDDVEAYEDRAKSVCSDFRILIERCVEKVLMNDVLTRFRRSVETKGKIGALARITPADCAYIDMLMTRYSTFEHSQPDELPAELPAFEDLRKDVIALAVWIDDFKKRLV
jgi:energy-coupling factor transporter ATP-binding protein EcfA2